MRIGLSNCYGLKWLHLSLNSYTFYLSLLVVWSKKLFSKRSSFQSRTCQGWFSFQWQKPRSNWLKYQMKTTKKFFTKMACGLWDIEIPSNTNKIADCPDEETEGKIEIEELQLGFRFYADMLNRVWFFIITLIIVFTFFCTFVQSWARY